MREGAKLVSLQPRHASITPYLRQVDVDEIKAMTGFSTKIAVAFSIASSAPGYAVELFEKPVAIFGAGYVNDNLGTPWLLATDIISQYPLHFYRISRDIFTEIKRKYKRLENYVDARNKLSLKWLKWLGFNIEPPLIMGYEGKPFHKIWYEGE